MSNAKVLFDYDAEADDELTLKEGDLITNIEKKEDGWWEGELCGRRGMFPENFVEEIKKQISLPPKEITEEKPVVSSEKSTYAKVTYDYDAENDDELTLKVGEMVKVLDQEEEGWWKGELNGKIGVFPTNFVEMVNETVQPSFSPPQQEQSEEKGPEKKTPKSLGGVGFGGILTQDALSGIKLRTTNSSSKIPPKKEKPAEQPTELDKRLSLKSRTPETPRDQPARPAKQSKIKEKALVEYDYEGEQSDELTLRKNEIINILEKDVTEGWWKGEVNGKVGLFPENFVKLITEEPKQESFIAKETQLQPDMPNKFPPGNDVLDCKPSRPEPFHKLKPTGTSGHKPPIPSKQPDEIPKKPELPSQGQDEKAPKMLEKPPKKSPPLLPKKPDKPKLPVDKPQMNKDQQVELRKRNGPIDPTKRFSEMPRTEVLHDTTPKRHSSGPDIALNLNEIKSTNVLQPLTSDRPKNPAKNPPTKYGKPNSPKKTSTPEKVPVNDVEVAKPVQLDKPKRPAVPDSPKPPESLKSKTNEAIVSSDVIEKLKDNINTLKASLESLGSNFKEHIQTSEKKFKAMEKKLTEEIDDITKELDEEKKARSALDVEVNRLKKLIKQQMSS